MPLRIDDWDNRIGRRLKLRDLHILSTVVRFGSMAKAASHLTMTQPAISQSVADLEAAIGVRLLDRGPRGVMPTIYGETLLKRGTEAFDALKQSVRDIEFLADNGSGEVWVGTSESYMSGGSLAAMIQKMARQHPRVAVHVVEANTAAMEFREVRERKVDLMLGRISGAVDDEDLNVDFLFEEPILAVAGSSHPLASRRNIELDELANEPWILAPPNTAVRDLVGAAFRAKGLQPPRLSVTTYSMQLRMQLLATGRYLTVFPASLVKYNAGRWPLKVLPVDLGNRLPVVIVTLKNRTLTPAVQLFINQAKAEAATMKFPAEKRK
jgi:DNA-binding transcriptional LysR family regulator